MISRLSIDLFTWETIIWSDHFIEFLAQTYGEASLWKVIEKQGNAFFFPFGVSLRFKAVYGKTLSGLLDEFNNHVANTFPVKTRPRDQRPVRLVGEDARYVTGPLGGEAFVASAGDAPPQIHVFSADGKLRRRRAG